MTAKFAIAIFVVVASESLVTMNVVTAITAGMVSSDALGPKAGQTKHVGFGTTTFLEKPLPAYTRSTVSDTYTSPLASRAPATRNAL